MASVQNGFAPMVVFLCFFAQSSKFLKDLSHFSQGSCLWHAFSEIVPLLMWPWIEMDEALFFFQLKDQKKEGVQRVYLWGKFLKVVAPLCISPNHLSVLKQGRKE